MQELVVMFPPPRAPWAMVVWGISFQKAPRAARKALHSHGDLRSEGLGQKDRQTGQGTGGRARSSLQVSSGVLHLAVRWASPGGDLGVRGSCRYPAMQPEEAARASSRLACPLRPGCEPRRAAEGEPTTPRAPSGLARLSPLHPLP